MSDFRIENKKVYDFHRFGKFAAGFEKFKDELPFELYVGLRDIFGTNWHDEGGYHHGDKAHKVIEQAVSILLESLPQAVIHYHKEINLVKLEELADKGQLDLLNVSMSWQNEVDNFNRIAKKGTDITASSGNDHLRPDSRCPYRYPAAQDRVTGVNAFVLNYPKYLPSVMGYGNQNDKVDIGGITNQYVYGRAVDNSLFDCRFGGTSCAGPDVVAFKIYVYFWFIIVFGYKPTYDEYNKYVLNSGYDYGEDGWETISGSGIPVLPATNRLHWCDFYYDYLVRKYNMRDLFSIIKDFDFDHIAKRGVIWIAIASMLGRYIAGNGSQLSMNRAFDSIQKDFKLFANNAEDPILKKDLIVVIARYLARTLSDVDSDGIADILDVDIKAVGEEAYYQMHIEFLEHISHYIEDMHEIIFYDLSEKALNSNVTYAVAFAMICRAFNYKETFTFLDL